MSGLMSIALDSNATITGLIPAEKMRGIYDLCRQHVSNKTLDMLLDGIARQSVDILGVRYSRILGLEIDGSLTCRAVHSNDRQDLAYRRKRCMPSQAQVLFQDALLRETPLVFKPCHPLPADLRTVLRLKYGDSLYLVPLRNQREVFGLMALGEETRAVSEAALAEKLRLAGIIADQAAGAFSRARLSISLEEGEIQTILALARVLEAHDAYIGSHSRKVTAVAVRLARALGCSQAEVQMIRWAAMLHDIGKVGISEVILTKASRLSLKEWEIIRRHPLNGAEIVRKASNLSYVAALVQAHHERFDGSGYPYGLQREMIPFGARILSVADAYAAMTDNRPYQRTFTPVEALAELKRCAGTQFDPKVVDAFATMFL